MYIKSERRKKNREYCSCGNGEGEFYENPGFSPSRGSRGCVDSGKTASISRKRCNSCLKILYASRTSLLTHSESRFHLNLNSSPLSFLRGPAAARAAETGRGRGLGETSCGVRFLNARSRKRVQMNRWHGVCKFFPCEFGLMNVFPGLTTLFLVIRYNSPFFFSSLESRRRNIYESFQLNVKL